jgi:hypothetical protein
MNYEKYSEKYIRNKDVLSKDESDLVELQASEEVTNFLNRFAKEPKFFKRVASKLTDKLVSRLDNQE